MEGPDETLDSIAFYYEDPREPVEIISSCPGHVTFPELVEIFRAFARRVGYSDYTIEQSLGKPRA